MAEGMDAAISAPRDKRAVMVFESGVTVSLRLKTREEVSAKRTIAQGKIETGYKISDGEVDDPKVASFEGIITGTDLPFAPLHIISAMNQAQAIQAAYDTKEFVSVYTSFMAMPQCRIKGMKLTRAQCDKIDKAEQAKALAWVDKNVHVQLTVPQKVGIASFCPWNIGPGKCFPSGFYRDLNAGNFKGACAQIKRWVWDAGRDCRIRENNCYGQVIRRDQESELTCWGMDK